MAPLGDMPGLSSTYGRVGFEGGVVPRRWVAGDSPQGRVGVRVGRGPMG